MGSGQIPTAAVGGKQGLCVVEARAGKVNTTQHKESQLPGLTVMPWKGVLKSYRQTEFRRIHLGKEQVMTRAACRTGRGNGQARWSSHLMDNDQPSVLCGRGLNSQLPVAG